MTFMSVQSRTQQSRSPEIPRGTSRCHLSPARLQLARVAFRIHLTPESYHWDFCAVVCAKMTGSCVCERHPPCHLSLLVTAKRTATPARVTFRFLEHLHCTIVVDVRCMLCSKRSCLSQSFSRIAPFRASNVCAMGASKTQASGGVDDAETLYDGVDRLWQALYGHHVHVGETARFFVAESFIFSLVGHKFELYDAMGRQVCLAVQRPFAAMARPLLPIAVRLRT